MIKKLIYFLILIFPILFFFVIYDIPEMKNTGSLKILDRNGIELYEYLGEDKIRSHWLTFDEISPWLVKTTVFREDKYFFLHPGINPYAILRAGIVNLKSRKFVLGGSTITMQVAKMMRSRRGKNLIDKLKEILLALKLEMRFSKKDILTYYLNRIYYGNQLLGCESASQYYFGKSAMELTLAQSAFLSVITSSPSFLNPYKNFQGVEQKARKLIYEMFKNRLISKENYDIAISEKIEMKKPENPILAPHFVFRILKEEEENIYHLSEIKTTLDYRLQKEVQDLLRVHLKSLKDKGVNQGAILVMDNRTGEWLVWVGSKDFWEDESFGKIDGCLVKRQPGSALKPFLYAEAFGKGFDPSSILPDIPVKFREEGRFYAPRNYSNNYSGPVRARVALSSSLNVPAVYLLSKIGEFSFYSALRACGIESLNKGERFYGLGLALGSGEVTLYELVRAYSIFPRKGVLFPEKKIIYYKDKDRNTEFPPPKNGKRVFDEKIAFLISSILSDNFSRTLGFSENSPLQFPYQVAVKTGTSEGFRDNFCIGYTKEWTVGVWVGNFEGKSMKGVSGVTGAGPLFHAVVNLLYKKKYGKIPYGERGLDEIPEGIIQLDICAVSGSLPSKDCEGKIKEYFIEGFEPTEICNWHRVVEIDSRNGLLASEWTSAKFRKAKLFLSPPPIYMEWARKMGFSLPPDRISDLKEGQFKIVSPVNGSIYQTLPDLPKNYQTVKLEVRTDILWGRVIWRINGKVLGAFPYPFTTRWNVERGFHEIIAEMEDGKYSDRVRVYVQ